jgi:hypothetical protein
MRGDTEGNNNNDNQTRRDVSDTHPQGMDRNDEGGRTGSGWVHAAWLSTQHSGRYGVLERKKEEEKGNGQEVIAVGDSRGVWEYLPAACSTSQPGSISG